MNSRTDRIRNAYCELYYENGELFVHCKEFKVKQFEKSKSTFDDLPDLDEKVVKVLKGKKIKVTTVLAAVPNIYYLCVLSALSKLLKLLLSNELKEEVKQLEILILFMELEEKGRRVEHLLELFKEHNERIFKQMGLEFHIPFVKSLINIMIRKLKLDWTSETFNKISIDFHNLNEYLNHKKIKDLDDNVKMKLKDIREKEIIKEISNRSKPVLFNTEMIYKLLRLIQHIDKEENVVNVFIVGEPVMRIILYLNELRKLRDREDVMIIAFSDPVHYEDTSRIQMNIPSFISILSRFYNEKKVMAYGLDEYYFKDLLRFLGKDRPEFRRIEEVIRGVKSYEEQKRSMIEIVCKGEEEKMTEVERSIYRYGKESQEEMLRIVNEMFLEVQKMTLEQLKLII